MRISYDIQAADAVFHQIYGASPRRRAAYRWGLPMALVVGIWMIQLGSGEPPATGAPRLWPDLLSPWIFLVAIVALVWGSEWMLRQRLARNPDSVLGRHDLEIVGDQIVETTTVSRIARRLTSVQEVSSRGANTVIRLSGGGSILIPNERLHEGDIPDFVDALESRLAHRQ